VEPIDTVGLDGEIAIETRGAVSVEAMIVPEVDVIVGCPGTQRINDAAAAGRITYSGYCG
jgi:hypothetical protein